MLKMADPIESCPRCKRGVKGEPEGDSECIYWKFKCPTPECVAIRWTHNAFHSEYKELLGRIERKGVE